MRKPEVTVYGAHWCPDCRRSKQFLGEHQIPYNWVDIEQDKQGEASLFARADEIDLARRLLGPILGGWAQPDAPPLAVYEPGSWDPAVAHEFLARGGRSWLGGCGGHSSKQR